MYNNDINCLYIGHPTINRSVYISDNLLLIFYCVINWTALTALYLFHSCLDFAFLHRLRIGRAILWKKRFVQLSMIAVTTLLPFTEITLSNLNKNTFLLYIIFLEPS